MNTRFDLFTRKKIMTSKKNYATMFIANSVGSIKVRRCPQPEWVRESQAKNEVKEVWLLKFTLNCSPDEYIRFGLLIRRI